jgi:secretion/DNA translocation related CpaE-like protein
MPPHPSALGEPPRPLLITADPQLLDEVVRLAAAADVTLTVAADAVAARSGYPGAPLVLVGADQAAACRRAGLPRRPDVVLVAAEPEPPWRAAEEVGAEHIALLPTAEGWLLERLCRVAEGRWRSDGGTVVAVVGGRGGAGASVLAAALAVTAAGDGRRVLLVDADPLGGGLDLVLGWESLEGLRWPSLDGVAPAAAGPTATVPSLVDALPCRGSLAVLACDRGNAAGVPPDAMAAAIAAGRGSRDLVVVDVARHPDEGSVAALAAAHHTLLVVPAELRACAAAARVAAYVGGLTGQLRLVVRGPAPGRLTAREISRALGLPLAGSLRAEPGLARALEHGEPPARDGRGPLAVLCRRLVAELTAAVPR